MSKKHSKSNADEAPQELIASPVATPEISGSELTGLATSVPKLGVPELLEGTVTRGYGDRLEVDVNGETLLCPIRGKLKHGRRQMSQPVNVGDRVRVRPLDNFGPNTRGERLREGYIEEVLPRRSQLGRARYRKVAQVSVANLDQVVVVMAARDPDINPHRLDRFLVLAEVAELAPIVCINKRDLVKKTAFNRDIKPILKLYEKIGYQTVAVSAETDEGIPELRAILKDHISAFVGSSGVGKSSVINAVQPGLRLYIGDVMEIGKGRHTTTEVSLHRLKGGGYLADTPGIKTVSLLDDDIHLDECFPEFREVARTCRFNDCSHLEEPGCQVRAGVEAGKIAASRYDSYKRIFEETAQTQRASNKQILEGRSARKESPKIQIKKPPSD